MIQFGGVTRIIAVMILGINEGLLVTGITSASVIVAGCRRWRRRIVARIHEDAIVGVGAVTDSDAAGSLGGRGGLHHRVVVVVVVVALHVRGLHDRLVRGLGR